MDSVHENMMNHMSTAGHIVALAREGFTVSAKFGLS